MVSDYDDPRIGKAGLGPGCGSKAVNLTHLDVHQDPIRPHLRIGGDGIGSVAALMDFAGNPLQKAEHQLADRGVLTAIPKT